ncbi:hypothetical protein LVJ94_22105 [Pendulispora rubella]|uniref:Carbohydrate-binding protein n=1 Tax=Pendulispora rubella TaxID=2741070 RepID=A0ABZ2LG49_9BACT
MAEQKESSVLFSLKELMSLEEDRIRQEESDRRRQEEDAINARLEAERRAREEEEARLRTIENERLADEQRQREEAARLEAIHKAEMERARLEAENAARLQQLRSQQEHAERVAALSQDRSKKKLLYIAVSSGVVLLLVLVFGGMAIKSSLDRQKVLEDTISTLNNDAEKLRSDIAQATTPEERARLERDLAENQKAMAELKANPGNAPQAAPRPRVNRPSQGNTATGTSGGSAPEKQKPCDCKPGDPLCSCL